MKKFDFEVTRRMDGDRAYSAGDSRKLSALDAAPLVRSGALKPKGKEAEEAMSELFAKGGSPDRRTPLAPAITDEAMDANNARAAAEGATPPPAKSGQTAASVAAALAKDAGDAERNKADIAAPVTGGRVDAGAPGVEAVKPAKLEPAAAPASAADATAGSADSAADHTGPAGGDEVAQAAAAGAATTAAPTTAKAAKAAAAKNTGKRRR